MKEQDTFFAHRLLERLETEAPMEIAFEAQAKSAEVGFDFATAHLAFNRLADEVRELSEALDKFEVNEDSREHLCDEATDVIFGTINVLRHAKLDMKDVFAALYTASLQQTELSVRPLLDTMQDAFHEFGEDFRSFEDSKVPAKSLSASAIALMQKALDFVNACKAHPDEVMKKNVSKYLIRCQFIEDQLRNERKTWNDLSLQEIYARWKQAKQAGL